MRTVSKHLALSRARQILTWRSINSISSQSSAAVSLRRIQNAASSSQIQSSSYSTLPLVRSSLLNPLPSIISSLARSFSSSPPSSQAAQPNAKPNPSETQSSSQPSQQQPSPEAQEIKKAADESVKKDQQSQDQQESPESEKKEGEESETKEEKKADEPPPPPPPPPHGDKTPWQVFMETLNTEFKASKDWNEGTKALQSGYNEFTQNPTLQKAKSAYEEASKTATSTTSAALKTTGEAIGKGASAVWESGVGKVTRKGATIVGSGIEKATRPVRETDAYKSVKNVIDDGSSSRYGGWIEKEERRKRRAAREADFVSKGGRLEKLEEDPEAGTNVTLHKDAAWKESWRDFRQTSKLFQSLDSIKSVYEQSDNPLITTARSWADTIGGFFAENETAMVIKKLREMDPNFQLEPFLIEMREYILPEVLDAYIKGDVETLKQWLSAAQYSVYAALMQQYKTAGLQSDGRILDIRNVEVANARLLDPGEVPVFVITCRTQEVHVYKNKKSGELAAGVDDKVQQVTYAIGVTRIAEDVNNPETRGWRLIELHKSARDYY